MQRGAAKLTKDIAAMMKRVNDYVEAGESQDPKKKGKGKGKKNEKGNSGDDHKGRPPRKTAWFCQRCGESHRNDRLQNCRT